MSILVSSSTLSVPVGTFWGERFKDGREAGRGSFGTLVFHEFGDTPPYPPSSLAPVDNGLCASPGNDSLRFKGRSRSGLNSAEPALSLVFGVLFFKNSTSFSTSLSQLHTFPLRWPLTPIAGPVTSSEMWMLKTC